MFNKIIKKALSPRIIVLYQNRLLNTVTSAHNEHKVIATQEEFDTRLLKVAIIGMPNAGKSTLINNLMDRKACATSSKVHTTRKMSHAIFTEEDAQIIFVDTPGLVKFEEKQRYKLEATFMRDCKLGIREADIIGVVHDVSNIYTREKLDIKIIKLLESHKEKSSFLIFNKIDVLKSKRKLLDLTRMLTEDHIAGKPIPGTSNRDQKKDEDVKGYRNFREIFMVSALTGSGMFDMKSFLINEAKPGKWLFPENVWTDQTAEAVIKETVKAKLLDFLPQEIPYELKTELEYLTINEDGDIKTVVLIHCRTKRVAVLIAGASDGRLRQITLSVQNDLQHTFRNQVKIRLVIQTNDDDAK